MKAVQMNSTPFTFTSKKTICPCGQHSSFTALTSHESGGKCWTCDKFFPPQNATTSPNHTRPTRPTTNEQKTAANQSYKTVKPPDREHIYWNEDGSNYSVKKRIWKKSDGGKACGFQRWKGELEFQSDGSVKAIGEWIDRLDGLKAPLYDSPILAMLQKLEQTEKEKHTVFIVEGEKDVLTLQKHGFIATTSAYGAKSWNQNHNHFFDGLNVVIIPDNDEPGHDHARLVFKNLQGIARRVEIIDLLDLMPDLPTKGDVTDYLERGGKL